MLGLDDGTSHVVDIHERGALGRRVEGTNGRHGFAVAQGLGSLVAAGWVDTTFSFWCHIGRTGWMGEDQDWACLSRGWECGMVIVRKLHQLINGTGLQSIGVVVILRSQVVGKGKEEMRAGDCMENCGSLIFSPFLGKRT